MTSYKSTEIEDALTRKGFIVTKKNKKVHHKKLTLFVNGKKTSVYTFISHGKKEYARGLLSAVKNQLFLDTSSELNDLISCPMSSEEYFDILIKKGIIKV